VGPRIATRLRLAPFEPSRAWRSAQPATKRSGKKRAAKGSLAIRKLATKKR
jgi:hypothetical protein